MEALKGVSKAMKAGPGTGQAAGVDQAITDFETLKAQYDALPGDLSLDRVGEKERLVTAMEQALTQALVEVAMPGFGPLPPSAIR